MFGAVLLTRMLTYCVSTLALVVASSEVGENVTGEVEVAQENSTSQGFQDLVQSVARSVKSVPLVGTMLVPDIDSLTNLEFNLQNITFALVVVVVINSLVGFKKILIFAKNLESSFMSTLV